MKLTFLGTGTSSGVPTIGCHCPVCQSTSPLDKRLRTSALIEIDGFNILIDAGPDVRTQMLRHNVDHIDALLVTHTHYDHLGGIDDLRPFSYPDGLDVYCRPEVARDIHVRLPYCFGPNAYPGAPRFNIHTIIGDTPFTLANGTVVTPLPVWHTPTLLCLGYRIDSLAYITDCKQMPDETRLMLHSLETLVINALRIKSHPSHMNLSDSLNVISSVKPRRALLTHISHQMGFHTDVSNTLPAGIELAYDGLEIEI